MPAPLNMIKVEFNNRPSRASNKQAFCNFKYTKLSPGHHVPCNTSTQLTLILYIPL